MDVTGQAIADLAPDVPIKFLPSPYQHARWGKWVSYDDGADVDGNFLGRCPLGEDEHGAVFNFVKDVMRCDGYPPCFPQRAKSLTNVAHMQWLAQNG